MRRYGLRIASGPDMVGTVISKAAGLALRAGDLALAATAAAAGAVLLLARRARRRSHVIGQHPRLLAFSSTYTLSDLRARQAEHLVTHRDLDGYFDRVWSVNPLVGADPREAAAGVGPPTFTRLNETHTMVEGKTRRVDSLSRLPHLNFVLAQVQLMLALDRIVRHEGISILRGDPHYSGLLAHLLGRMNSRPVEIRIIANHDAIYETVGALAYPRLFRWRALEQRVARFTFSRADAVVAGSADNGAFALRNAAREERLRYTGHGGMIAPVHMRAPSQRARLADELGLGDRPVVACVSRLERMKHPEDVVMSVAKARERDPRIAGVLIGDGAMRAELESLCVDLGVEADVILTGERDQGWIASFLTQTAVVAAPLAGLALVEAALGGSPIVAYDVEWHSELIMNERDGILVPYRDTDAMAEAICALVADPGRAARLAASARRRALEMLAPAKALAGERAIADELLGTVPAPAAGVASGAGR